MATLSLKISMADGSVVKTMQFDPSTTVYDACRIIKEKTLEANMGDIKDYGLFLASDEDSKKGIWLEGGRTLEHYMLRNGDTLELNTKLRKLRVRMLDGSVKTMQVDDSQVVANLMVVICTKIGITNYDEYGLVREDQKEEQESSERGGAGTLTLRRRNHERDAKMEQLRKKIRTDDEVNWVDPALTLREQGIEGAETLLLRRKFFFSDRNVDSRDPVQLNLLYVQARDAILDGTHPINQDKALEFAGLQCQIQFGDHRDDKNIAEFLDPKEFMPASFAKVKGIEKKIIKEHRKHVGLSELDAKVMYTKNARALPTYGVAFFLVKEKMKGKNKLVPRLLGVSKDSVLRLDEKTKDILQTWPLTTVRRWCGSPNTFTLDFGDYSDQYYSVQTTEAEQILQVISGYIDIILKKQKAKDHFGIEGDEGSAMLEDVCSPTKAQILQHESTLVNKAVPESVAIPAVVRPGGDGSKSFVVTHTSGAMQTTTSGQITIGHQPPTASQSLQVRTTSVLSEPQRALLTTIRSGRELIREMETHLVRASLPTELGRDAASLRWKETQADSSRQAVTSHMAAMNAATAQVVTLTCGPMEEVDHTAVGAAITTITTNLPEMTKGVQMLAALMEDDDSGDRLLDATRKLCSAFTDLLKAAEPETKETRQNLLNAASRVGEASTNVLYTIGEETEETKEVQDILLSQAKAVANTTAALVLKAKNVAATLKDDQPAQNRVISAATQCALATSQLVACAKVVAPTLQSPACREQLTEAARAVAQAVEALLAECRAAGAGGRGEGELQAAAAEVCARLRDMLDHVQPPEARHASVREPALETVMTAAERLMSSQADSGEMVRRARLLGQATAHLITDIKTQAEQNPQSEQQRRLLAAAKLLADATARMVEAARQCASSPQDRGKQEALRRAAEELRYITADYAQGQDLVESEMRRVEEAARAAAEAGAQLAASAHSVGAHNTNKREQESLMEECRHLQEATPQLMEAVKEFSLRPDRASSRLQLTSASETYLQQTSHVESSVRSVLPTVTDNASAKQLNEATLRFSASRSKLGSAVERAMVNSKGLQLDAAAQVIESLREELDRVEEAARAFDLKPMPGETAEWASQSLASSARNTASSVAQLVSSLRHDDSASGARACADTAHGLREFVASVRAVAATSSQQPDRLRVIESGRQVLVSSLTLVETAKRFFTSSERVDITTVMNTAKDISQKLAQTTQAVPSHKELDVAIENINDTLNVLSMGEFPHSDRSYNVLQEELHSAAAQLSAASSETVQAVERPAELPESSRAFNAALDRLVGVAAEMCGRTEEDETRTQMLTSMRSVTIASSRLLTTVKSVVQDVNQPNARNRLTDAARAVTDAVSDLVDTCTSAAPGPKECDRAIRSIQSTLPLLSSPSEAVNELGYYACLDAVVTQSKSLSEGMSGMANSAKHSDQEQFVRSVGSVASAICGLVECTAQAAYLVGISDETSVAGRPGLVDQAQFLRAAQNIERACESLAEPSSDQQQVLSAATVIAKHTSALCNACRVASGRTTNPQAKRHFVQAAKDVANSTAALVKEIKALDSDYSEGNRERCAEATGPLLDAVHGLCQFANSAEFASVPARISPQARLAQQAILDDGRNIIRGSCSMVEAAKVLSVRPADKPQWQSLATHSKTVSDSIKSLVNNIRDKAPGQRECAAALQALGVRLRALDDACLRSVQDDLPANRTNTLPGFCEQVESAAAEMLERVEAVRVSACGEAERLGHSVSQFVSYAEPLSKAGVGAASNVAESALRQSLLEQCKTVIEGAAQLVEAAKDAGGNPRATGAHPAVQEHARDLRSSLGELSGAARALCTQHGLVGGLLDDVARSIAVLTSNRMSFNYDETDSFVDYQSRMVAVAQEISRIANDMSAKSESEAGKLVGLGSELAERFARLAQDAAGAAATATNPDCAHRIRSSVAECGEGVSQLVKCAGQRQLANNSPEVADSAVALNDKVLSVLAALQAGSRGTQACIDAANSVSAIIGDLDTTILFASAGTLHSEKEQDSFSEHRESILKTAKSLVEDTKTLVGGAAGSQQQLSDAAQCSVSTIVQLAEIVKLGAMSLGSANPDSQVMLIHAVRDVAAALRDLIHATKDASGKHITHPHMDRLKDSAKRPGDHKRWSLPTCPAHPRLRPSRRRSINIHRYNESADSETDWFISDQEEELVKLLDYSSQDEISPPIFQNIIEKDVSIEEVDSRKDGVKLRPCTQEGYEKVTRNSIFNMDWRIVKYGENILIGEINKLVDVTEDLANKEMNKIKRSKLIKQRVELDLETEMKRLSQVMEEMDVEELVDCIGITDLTKVPSQTIKPRHESKDQKIIKNTTFKVKKVRPVNLVINLDVPKDIEIIRKRPKVVEEKSKESNKDEATTVMIKPEIIKVDENNSEFWKMFRSDTEVWKVLAQKNLERNEETRKELARFSGHELVLGDFENEMNKYEEERNTLQSFIDDVEMSRSINKELIYNKKYEEMVIKLIEFAKSDFIQRGFDPLIEKLEQLSNLQIEPRKKKTVIIENIDVAKIDVTKYTYEELCVLEKYYKNLIKKYKHDKENLVPGHERSPSVESEKSGKIYHKNIVLNVESSQNKSKNINRVKFSPDRAENENKQVENYEIHNITRTYPAEYYANNWWSIYEDILKTREDQFGSIDNWWKFYEAILNKESTDEEELNRIRAVVEHRNMLRMNSRNKSRMEDQLKTLDEIKNSRFKETEDTQTKEAADESVMVTNVTSLLKTVKAVEDEHTRGTRALESTIEAIAQEIKVLLSPSAPRSLSTAEELIRVTRQLTGATAKAVTAGNSARQDDIIAAANAGRKAVSDLLAVCKGAAYAAEGSELRERIVSVGHSAGVAYRELLQAVLEGAGARHQLPEASRRIAQCAADMIAAAHLLKGSDWVDPDDPTVIAENELLGAAASIDAAANKLAALRPRRRGTQEADETLNFDEMILEAAKSIIAATSALVRAASAAQRELVDQGKMTRRPVPSSDDGQWSEGLISAARMVAAAAHSLVEAANALVQGNGSEEKLIGAAKQVASSTAHLLIACKVKADPSSESFRRLQAAGGQVIRSTDNLVRAARDSINLEEERCLVLNTRVVGGIKQEIDARSEVLRIERELEEARSRLKEIRHNRYNRSGAESGDETDTSHYTSHSASNTPGFNKPAHYLNNSGLNSSYGNTTYSPNSTFHQSSAHGQNSTNLNTTNYSHNTSGYDANASYGQSAPDFGHNTSNAGTNTSGLSQNSPAYGRNVSGYGQNASGYGQNTQSNLTQHASSLSQNIQQLNQSIYGSGAEKSGSEKTLAHAPPLSSFRPASDDQPKQNYEGFTTRVIKSAAV